MKEDLKEVKRRLGLQISSQTEVFKLSRIISKKSEGRQLKNQASLKNF